VNAAGVDLPKRTNLKFTTGLNTTDDGATNTVVALANTTVAAGTYGTSTKTPQITVDAQGRITSVTELSIPGVEASGYVTIYSAGSAVQQRSYLNVVNGLVTSDDAANQWTTIGLPTVGTATSKGTAARSVSLTTDVYGRVTALSDQLISIDPGTQLSANVPLSKLPQASINTVSTLVARDGSGNFSAGTITATSFSGPLSGNATSASSVEWSGVANKPGAWMSNATLTSTIADLNTSVPSGFYSGPGVANAPTANAITAMIGRYNNAGVTSGFDLVSDVTADGLWYRYFTNGSYGAWRKVMIENSGTYAINISGNAATASAIAWGSVSSKPAVFNTIDGNGRFPLSTIACSSASCDANGNYVIDNAEYATTAGSANAVAWTNVSGRPSALSQFTNDPGYQTAAGSVNYANSAGSAGSSTNSTNWIGGRQINWAYGDGTNALTAMTNAIPVWRNRLFTTATVTVLTCRVNSGSVNVTLTGNGGGTLGTVTCGTGWTAIGLGNNALSNGQEITFRVTSVAGTPTSVSFEGGYTVAY
jgi:hypothetical protein